MLCQLSYIGLPIPNDVTPVTPSASTRPCDRTITDLATSQAIGTRLGIAPVLMERETGIEPATNSLEGCDSTTELLPLRYRCVARPSVSNSWWRGEDSNLRSH